MWQVNIIEQTLECENIAKFSHKNGIFSLLEGILPSECDLKDGVEEYWNEMGNHYGTKLLSTFKNSHEELATIFNNEILLKDIKPYEVEFTISSEQKCIKGNLHCKVKCITSSEASEWLQGKTKIPYWAYLVLNSVTKKI